MAEHNGHAPDGALITLFDRRVEQIESALSVVTGQLHDQSRSLNQITDALTAVVRLEERLTASIENSKEQRASIQRVHDRLDEHTKQLSAAFAKQVEDRSEEMAEIYARIDQERKDCSARFIPLNNEINQQKGALRFAAFLFPLLFTVALALLGGFVSTLNTELKELSRAVSRHDTTASNLEVQLHQLRKDVESNTPK